MLMTSSLAMAHNPSLATSRMRQPFTPAGSIIRNISGSGRVAYRPALQQLRASPDGTDNGTGAAAVNPDDVDAAGNETVFYEGSGADAELVVSILLGATLLYLPLTMASIGRRLWVQYKFTSKRLIITTKSPVLKREIQVEYSKIKEIRAVARAFGAWGDAVIFLKDGSRLELVGLENHAEIKTYIENRITA